MMTTHSMTDKDWATKYLLDPLTAPEPAQETGPGTHFYPRDSHSKHDGGAVKAQQASTSSTYPTPPSSASPSRRAFSSNNPYSARPQAFPSSERSRRARAGSLIHDPAGVGAGTSHGKLPSRSMSVNGERPLDIIKRETNTAYRSPHLRKKHVSGADTIDALDRSTQFAYHHEGPYDATLLSRNLVPKYSPVEAVRASNEEALKATPTERVRDALERHMPLQGTATIPPGEEDLSGRRMSYEEGADLMREPDAAGGAYKRWPDMKYHPDDLKGKGEPSYTLDQGLKKREESRRQRVLSDGDSAYEMQSYPRSSTSARTGKAPARRLTRLRSQSDNDAERSVSRDARLPGMKGRTSLVGSRGGGDAGSDQRLGLSMLRKRFGSLRSGKNTTDT